MLTSRILSGAYPPGSLIGTEKELCEDFEVSRITIRQSLDILEAEGLIERRRAKGTFVAPSVRPHSRANLYGFLDDLKLHQEATETTHIEVREADAPPEVALKLGVAPGSRLVVLRRTRSQRLSKDKKPILWLVNHLPLDIGSRYSAEELRAHTLLDLLDKDPDIKVGSSEQWIGARSADAEVAKYLKVEVGAPILYVEGVVYAEDGRPIEHVSMHYPPEGFTYRVRLRA